MLTWQRVLLVTTRKEREELGLELIVDLAIPVGEAKTSTGPDNLGGDALAAITEGKELGHVNVVANLTEEDLGENHVAGLAELHAIHNPKVANKTHIVDAARVHVDIPLLLLALLFGNGRAIVLKGHLAHLLKVEGGGSSLDADTREWQRAEA